MNILRATDTEYTEIQNFLNTELGDEATIYPVSKANTLLVTKNETGVIGIGALFDNSFYGKVPTLLVVVKREFRRKRLGTKIHKAIERASIDREGFYGFFSKSNLEASSFLSRLGYQSFVLHENVESKKILIPENYNCYRYKPSIFSRLGSKISYFLFEAWLFFT